ATVISVGTATIAAAIGAGGLGTYIFRGLRTVDRTLILAGAIPAAIMALGADFTLGWIERTLSPGATRVSKIGKWILGLTAFVIGVAVTSSLIDGAFSARGQRIIVGSKDFTESRILAELVAQVVEANTNVKVDQASELSGDLCHRNLIGGQIDMYVEYT